MNLLVERITKTDNSTIGKLYIDGKFFCYTLEDVERDVKIYGETAIPKGVYDVIIDRSVRFKRDLPLLLNVKGFDGVRIHRGNNKSHTLGCILVGYKLGIDFIGDSSKCEIDLVEILKKADKIKLEIK